MDQVLAAYPKQVRFVYKQFPLEQIHANAMNAAKASIAAGNQGKFWEMHDELFKIFKNLTTEEIRKARRRSSSTANVCRAPAARSTA